eukprot:TRINITY_DN21785_c0_g1_i2.p1 TRINITY_DN21785_c0_g1~~TRINITY_DN21785_c0_g1_i2.p1  ORF type:complete len:563 (+),score=156.61 TRINITY_DN21785_c0_g1_i2:213-1901(+)
MFYSQLVLTKRGPLGRIWLAAHWEKKLTKTQVNQTNIIDSVHAIAKPDVPLALRTSGHLLLGIVRILERQAKYLLLDCGDALSKIKQAFRSGEEIDARQAAAVYDAVTLQEGDLLEEELDDFVIGSLPDNYFFDVQESTQARREEITLQETKDPISTQLSRSNSIRMDDEMFDVGRGEVLTFSENSRRSLADDDTMLSPERLRDAIHPSSGIRMDVTPQDFETEFDFEHLDPHAALDSGRTPISQGSGGRSSQFTNGSYGEMADLNMDYGLQDMGQVQFKGKRSSTVLVDDTIQISASEIREMLHDTSELVREPTKMTPSRRKKRQRITPVPLPCLREPLVPDFPAAICSMIIRNMSDEPEISEVEKLRNVATPRSGLKDRMSRADDGGVLDAELEGEEAVLGQDDMDFGISGDMGEEQQFSDLTPRADDFQIPALLGQEFSQAKGSSGLQSTQESMGSTFPMEAGDGESDDGTPSKDGFTSRTRGVISDLKDKFAENKNHISFQSFVKSQLSRSKGIQNRVAAQSFYEMLVLKSRDLVEVQQKEPYSAITIAPTKQLDTFQ